MPRSTDPDPQVRHVFEQWRAKIRARDLEGLVNLYAKDGIFKSPAVLALNGGRDGILRGHDELKPYFRTFFSKLDSDVTGYSLPAICCPTH
jgi:ketosteroid isomerase-like protein